MTETLGRRKVRERRASKALMSKTFFSIEVRKREDDETNPDVQSTSVLFLIVQAAVIPTSVFPAPQGKTMIPDLARLIIESGKDPKPSVFSPNEQMARWKEERANERRSLPVSEHLGKRLLLIGSDDGNGLEVDLEVGVDVVVPEVVLFEDGELDVFAAFLDDLWKGRGDRRTERHR
jgi:hypothetical protein